MKILALETSARAASAAVVAEDTVVAAAYQCTGLTHSRTLMPMVEAMMKNADLSLSDIDAVAVANGPGSFTGIRIGVAAAKGLAFAGEKPVAGVSTLEAMARGCSGMDGLIICAMDARRAQVYNALFTAGAGQLVRRTPDRAIGLSELAEEIKKTQGRKIIVGDGAAVCYNFLLENQIACALAPPQLVMQNATGVGLVALDMARAGKLVSPQELLPCYLRPAQAERLKGEKQTKEQSK